MVLVILQRKVPVGDVKILVFGGGNGAGKISGVVAGAGCGISTRGSSAGSKVDVVGV